MHSDKTIDKFLDAKKSGLNYIEAADVANVSIYSGWQWSRGKLPHGYSGKYVDTVKTNSNNLKP